MLPPQNLAAESEHEVCFATYYDFSDTVPADYKDPTGQYFRYSGQELRQDPTSHHLVLLYSDVPAEQLHHPAFGDWACSGGDSDGQVCEPTDTKSCGAGFCHSRIANTLGCIGFGPPGYSFTAFGRQIGGCQADTAARNIHHPRGKMRIGIPGGSAQDCQNDWLICFKTEVSSIVHKLLIGPKENFLNL